MRTSTPRKWAEFSINRLGDLCRLQNYCESYADAMTMRFLQHAIFSVYLDCRHAGVRERADEVLSEWITEAPWFARPAPAPAEAK
jgi:hypothetical protein